jgi:hypothetical protein
MMAYGGAAALDLANDADGTLADAWLLLFLC